jgi:predicted lipoprotein
MRAYSPNFLLFAVTLLLSCCHASSALPTESEVLSSLIIGSIEPSVTKMADTAEQLEIRVHLLCEDPNAESLELARNAWRNAYLAWCQAAPFRFGPGNRLYRQIGQWFVNGVVLDAAVESTELDDLLQQVEQRGYAAVEYLLFTPPDATAATTTGRSAHLRETTEEIAKLTADVHLNWETHYADQFRSAGNGAPFLIQADALSLFLSEVLNVTEQLLRDRIGVPSGFFEGASKPDRLEAWKSHETIVGLQATLVGLQLAIKGDGEASLVDLVATKDGLVEARNPALAKAIRKQFDKIEKILTTLRDEDLTLAVRLKKNPKTMKRLYGELQDLQDDLIEASLVLELDVHSGIQSMLTTETD